MLGSFRQPKQKLNYVTDAQLLPSAPNLANTMLVEVDFVVRPMNCPTKKVIL
jgi:hypothetical protein